MSTSSVNDDDPGPFSLRRVAVVGLALALVACAVYADCFFGNKLLLYKDMGSDSVNDSYPYLVHLSHYLRTAGFPSWSFSVGMGQSIFYRAGDLLWQPVVWLPRDWIAPALVFQHFVKILLAGVFFFRFLQLRGVQFTAALLGALLLSFSGYMCLGSCWYTCADETVAFALVLCAVEKALAHGRWIYLAWAVAVVGLVTVFHFYLCAVLLSLYVPFRLFEKSGWHPGAIAHKCLQLAGVALLGVGLAAVICFGSAYAILNSARGSGDPIFNWSPVPAFSHLESPVYDFTALLRPFSIDILGTGDEFRGWQNYFEAPQSYCGLIILLLLPQIFVGVSTRRRILYGLFLLFVTVPVICPWFRYLFWLFKDGYFRAFTLFSVFGLLALSLGAFSRYLGSAKLNLWLLAATLLVLIGILYCPAGDLAGLINAKLRLAITFLLIGYVAMLLAGQLLKRQQLAGYGIVLLSIAELIYLDRITVASRPTVTKTEMGERVGFRDQTVEAVADIKAKDNGLFRITKTWGSGPSTRVSYNDALNFDYYGTMSYSSFNSLNYIRFLMATDVMGTENAAVDSLWSLGLLDQPLLLTFAGEKYAITKKVEAFEGAEQYEHIARYGDIHVFRNNAALPFGLIFNQVFPEDLFLQMPPGIKAEALVRAAAIPASADTASMGVVSLGRDQMKQQMREIPLNDVLAERRTSGLAIESFSQTRITARLSERQAGVLVMPMPFDPGWHASRDGRNLPVLKVDAGLTGVVLGEGGSTLQLWYRPPWLLAGAAVTLLSWAAFILAAWRWPRIANWDDATVR